MQRSLFAWLPTPSVTQAPDKWQYCEPDTIDHMPFAGALAGTGGMGAGGGGGKGDGGGGDSCEYAQPSLMIW